jgi:omega-6 fatty acid desaturase (delta-12 desaturase)
MDVKSETSIAHWKQIVAKYQEPALWPAVWQVLNTVVPYLGLWWLMYWSLEVSYWLTFGLAVLAGGLLIRLFIIFHDCGHGSFFKSARANHTLGFITGVLTFTPYWQWRWEHALHHASAGDLDRRGTGDVWTLTVEEYLAASRWKRFSYRLARNPFVLFILAPLFLFWVFQRFPNPKARGRERHSVYWTNLCIALLLTGLWFAMGWKALLLISLAVWLVAGAAGVWLFYVQHQFDGVYWERQDNWNYELAALQGSSFYKLPRILQWFSGNIGFHHIHHLSPRIPNYNLEKCHKAEPLFQAVKPVTFFASLKSLTYRLWDERQRRLVGFGALRRARQRALDQISPSRQS